MVISLSGRKGAGKSEVASVLVNNHGFERTAFAKTLKDVVGHVFDIPVEDLNDPKKKEEHLNLDSGLTWDSDTASKAEKFLNIPEGSLMRETLVFMSYRDALAKVGTEVLRNYDSNFHVNSLLRNLNAMKGNFAVVDDTRFPNEVDCFQNIKGKTSTVFVRVIRPNAWNNITNHASENSIGCKDATRIIVNDSSLESLRSAAENLVTNASWTDSPKLIRMSRDALHYGESAYMRHCYGSDYKEICKRESIYLHDFSKEGFTYNQTALEITSHPLRNEIDNMLCKGRLTTSPYTGDICYQLFVSELSGLTEINAVRWFLGVNDPESINVMTFHSPIFIEGLKNFPRFVSQQL
jgi:hypothetical protein